MLHVTDR